MKYVGKLFGQIGRTRGYFDLGKTSEDWDALEARAERAEAEVERLKHGTVAQFKDAFIDELKRENTELRLSGDEHAKGYVETRKRIAALESEIDRLHAINAVRESAIARAERAEADLKEWSLLNLWGGTPEIIHAFVKGQQARIHAAQDVEAELDATRERALTLADSLDKAEAELTAERARSTIHASFCDDALTLCEDTGIAGHIIAKMRELRRAAIDAAMQEGE